MKKSDKEEIDKFLKSEIVKELAEIAGVEVIDIKLSKNIDYKNLLGKIKTK